MQAFDVLSILAQLAIAITGFSGVVSVFSPKAGATFGNLDYLRLASLLTASLSAFVLCVIAILLLIASIDEKAVWRIVSLLVAFERAVWLSQFVRNRNLFSRRGQALIFFYIFSAGGALVIMLASTNALLLGMFWPFTSCIVWYLIESSFVFVRLTLRRVAPDERA
jgi:fumarate reductase subunit D